MFSEINGKFPWLPYYDTRKNSFVKAEALVSRFFQSCFVAMYFDALSLFFLNKNRFKFFQIKQVFFGSEEEVVKQCLDAGNHGNENEIEIMKNVFRKQTSQ